MVIRNKNRGRDEKKKSRGRRKETLEETERKKNGGEEGGRGMTQSQGGRVEHFGKGGGDTGRV